MRRILLYLITIIYLSPNVQAQVLEADSLALVALYNSTGGPNWTNNTNWLDPVEPVSSWFGVTVTGGRVTSLILHDDGTETFAGNNLVGTLPVEIGDLTSVTTMAFSDNNLNGSIPSSVGTLIELSILNLDGNQLTGSIPAEISNLASLSQLLLYSNQLSGNIPAELGDLVSLTGLYIWGNQLSGTVPESFVNLSALTVFSISSNPDLCEPETTEYLDWTTGLDTYDNSGTCLNTCETAEEITVVGTYTAPEAPYWYTYTSSGIESLVISSEGSGVDTNLEVYDACDGNLIAFNDDISLGESIFQSELQMVLQASQTIYIHWTPRWSADGFDWSLEASPYIPIDESDSLALVALYNATDGPNWKVNTNWLEQGQLVGTWQGVTTENGRVVGINLEDDGTGSFAGNGLIGQLPNEIGDLTALEALSLEGNSLSGPIPAVIGNLSSLKSLILTGNEFSGSIPTSIGQLSNLETLNLPLNQLSGSIPAELGNLNNLKLLRLWENQLTGEIPSELGNLTNLTRISIRDNQLTGELPTELGSLSSLTHLLVSDNNLSGTVPESYVNLTALVDFRIQNNPGLCEPATQAYVDWTAGLNNFENDNTCLLNCEYAFEVTTGNYSALFAPHWYTYTSSGIESLVISSEGSGVDTNLEVYDACDGNLIAFNDDISLGESIFQSELQMVLQASQTIYIHWTPRWSADGFDWSLEASPYIPIDESDSLALVALYNATDGPNWKVNTNWLEQGQLVGTWQGVTTENGRVVGINLEDDGTGSFAGNGLIGQLPNEIGDLTALEALSLEGNSLSGPIPAVIGNLSSLKSLILTGNEFSGSIPTSIGQLSNLETLNLPLNQLSGSIPAELGNLNNLKLLRLWENQLTGEIPSELGNLTNLTRISIRDNQLTGELPTELGSLSSLTHLLVSDNNLSGTVPESYVNLTALVDFRIQNNPGLCEPATQAYVDWTAGLSNYNNENTCQVEADILSYEVPEQLEDAVIDNDNLTITVALGCLEDYNLIPSFTLSEGAIASINNQEQTSGSSTIDFSNPLAYEVTAGSGAIETWTVNVELPATIEAYDITVLDNTSCTSGNGEVTLNNITMEGNVITDFSNYTLSWSDDDFASSLGSEAALSSLEGGAYQLRLTNNTSGCVSETIITVNDVTVAPEITFSTTDNTICTGTGNGSIAIDNPDTDNFAYTYFEGTPDNIGNELGSGGAFNGFSAGNYVVEVGDLNTGCITTEAFEISETIPAISVDADISAQTNCDVENGEITISSITIEGMAILLPDNRFDLTWTDTDAGNVRTALPAGTYSLTITDTQTGCTYDESFSVQSQTLAGTIQVASTTNVTSCTTNNGGASVTVDGETSGFEFSWFTGGSADGTAFSTSNSISGLAVGSYTVKVSEQGSDCFSTRTINIGNGRPNLSLTLNATENVNCENPIGTVSIVSIERNGVVTTNFTGYDIIWSTSPALTDEVSDEDEVTGLGPDRYYVQVTERASGCTSAITSIIVDETLTLPVFTVSTANNTLCGTTGDGTATLTGVEEGQKVAWYAGESETAIADETSTILDNLTAGNYRAEVTTTATGCRTTETFTITDVPATITVNAAAINNTSCVAPNGSVSVESITVDGTALQSLDGYTIEWSAAQDFGNTLSSTENLSAGSYFVRATNDATGCSSAVTTLTVVDELPQLEIDLVANTLDRPGSDATGSLEVSISGSNSFSIAWHAGPDASGDILSTTSSLSEQQSGLYTILLTDAESGCSVTESFTIEEEDKLLQQISFTLPEMLFQDELPLTLSAISDQGLPITYEVIEGEGTIDGDALIAATPGVLTIMVSSVGNETYTSAEAEATVEIKGNYDLSGTVAPLSDGSSVSGRVILLLQEGNALTTVEEVELGGDNSFLFDEVRAGIYVIKVDVQPNQGAYDTYYDQATFSVDATGIDLQSDFSITINMVEVPDEVPQGTGRIIGTVVGNAQGNRILTGRTLDGDPLPDVNVFLLEATTQAIIAQAITDESGAFELTGIPSGNYIFKVDAVNAEIADLSTEITFDEEAGDLIISAAISEDGLIVETEVSEVTNVEEISSTIRLYPNPAREVITIESPLYKLKQIRLINLSGQLLQTFIPNFSGQYLLNKVKPGLYLLQLETEGSDIVTRKLRIE